MRKQLRFKTNKAKTSSGAKKRIRKAKSSAIKRSSAPDKTKLVPEAETRSRKYTIIEIDPEEEEVEEPIKVRQTRSVRPVER